MSHSDYRIQVAAHHYARDAVEREAASAADRVAVHITTTSANGKTGPILVTTTSANTCPPTCPLNNGGGCYASAGGPLAIHWRKVTSGERGTSWPVFIDALRIALKRKGKGALWRHNQAGDLPGDGRTIHAPALAALADVNHETGTRGFTYTHYPVGRDLRGTLNLIAIQDANARGFTINLSANGLGHADALIDDIETRNNPHKRARPPVCAVVAEDHPARSTTPRGRLVVVCPAQQREGVTCATCRLCARADRPMVIAFRVHGTSAKRAAASIQEGVSA
jgi:hypothetical protein